MAKIICKISMFGLNQTLYLNKYDNTGKEITEIYSMPLKDIPNFIFSQKDVDEVCLAGPKLFIKKLEEDTYKLEIEKYSEKKTNFIYL